jgi:TonB family protein
MVVEGPGLVAGARPEQASARVRLRLFVREDGSVGRVDIVVSSGRPELDDAAESAAHGWRFAPARRDGTPIASTVLIWVSFVVGP